MIEPEIAFPDRSDDVLPRSVVAREGQREAAARLRFAS
jgi:hypothetical protein